MSIDKGDFSISDEELLRRESIGNPSVAHEDKWDDQVRAAAKIAAEGEKKFRTPEAVIDERDRLLDELNDLLKELYPDPEHPDQVVENPALLVKAAEIKEQLRALDGNELFDLASARVDRKQRVQEMDKRAEQMAEVMGHDDEMEIAISEGRDMARMSLARTIRQFHEIEGYLHDHWDAIPDEEARTTLQEKFYKIVHDEKILVEHSELGTDAFLPENRSKIPSDRFADLSEEYDVVYRAIDQLYTDSLHARGLKRDFDPNEVLY